MEFLIKNTEDLSDYVKVADDFSVENIKPGLMTAEREYIAPILGKATCDRLKSEDAQVNGLEAIDQELLTYVKPALVQLAFLEMIDEFDTELSTSGITVNVGENQKIASHQRVFNLKQSYFMKAQKNLDLLIAFLLENGENIEDFDGSDEQVMLNHGFISNAAELQYQISWPVGHYAFTRLRPVVRQVQEEEVRKVLCDQLFDFLLQGKESNGAYTVGGVNYSAIVPLVQKFVAFRLVQYAVSNNRINISHDGIYLKYIDGNESVEKTSNADAQLSFKIELEFKNKADKALSDLKKHLISKRTEYTLWASSTCAATGTNETINNTSGKGILPLFGA